MTPTGYSSSRIVTLQVLAAIDNVQHKARARRLDWDADDVEDLRDQIRKVRAFAKRWNLDATTIVITIDGGATTRGYNGGFGSGQATEVRWIGSGHLSVSRVPARTVAHGDCGLSRATIVVPAGHKCRTGATSSDVRFVGDRAFFE